MDPDPKAPAPPGYVSPYGRPRGLRARLAKHRANLSDRQYSWHGTGIIDDMELLMKFLNKREWLEAMRLSPDPEAQQFAAELLADDETLDAAYDAATHVKAIETDDIADDPVAVTEALDAEATKAQATNRGIRRVLEQAGVADDATTDEELPDLLRALLA